MRIIGAGNIDAVSRPQQFGRGQAVLHMSEVLAPLLRIRVEHIAPAAHFRNHHIPRGEFLDDGLDSVRIVHFHFGGVSGSIPEADMLLGKFRRVIRFEKNRTPQAQGA